METIVGSYDPVVVALIVLVGLGVWWVLRRPRAR